MKNPYFRLQFISAFLGNLFEHYDLALYTLLAPFFATLFFSPDDLLTGLILTYGIIPIGMLARPLGALLFGFIGDFYGRRKALFISLLSLGVVSAFFAFLPTYEKIGVWAPVCLAIGRILQNFFGIGENLGGGIYLLENTSEKHQDLISGFYGASTIAGYLLASFGVSVLYYYDALENYWRVLYLLGCLTAVFGSILRKHLPNHIENVSEKNENTSLSELFRSLWYYRRTLLGIALVAGFSYANASIALIFLNGFIPLISSFSNEQMVHLNTLLLLFDFVTMPLFGLLAMRFSRQKMMSLAALCVVLAAIPLFACLEKATLAGVIAIRMLIVLFGVWFSAPFHSWAQQLVPPSKRYRIISFGYAIGSQIFGGPTALISLWLYKQTHVAWMSAGYWMILALATTVLLVWFPLKAFNSFQEVKA